MKKRIALTLLALPMVGSIALAGPASAATCIPSPGSAAVPPTYETVVLVPGSAAVEEVSHPVFQFQRVTEQTFRVGEVPIGWTVVGEPFEVVDVEYVPAIPEETETQRSGWVRERPEGDGWIKYDERDIDATYKTQYQQTRVTVEAQPAVPPVGKPTIVVPNPDYVAGYTKHHDAVYATDYKYVKQVQGVVQSWNVWKGKWETTGSFGWENWTGNSTRWESESFAESGAHNGVQSESWTTRKVSTEYRYAKTGETRRGALIKAAWDEWVPPVGEPTKTVDNPDYVPGKDAVEEQRETQWFDTQEVEGWTFTGETQPVQTAPAYTEYKFKRTVVTQEYVPEVKKESHLEVDAAYTETSDWVTETETVDYEGWDLIGQDKVVTVEGKPAVDEITGLEMTDKGKPAVAPVVCEDESEGDDAVTVVVNTTPTTPPAPAKAAEQQDALAVTGSSPVAGAAIAGGLVALGGTLMLARRRTQGSAS